MLRTILAGAVLFVGLSVGWQLRATWSLWAESRAQARTVRVMANQAAVTAQVDLIHQGTAETTRLIYRTLYREIPRYVPSEAVARCTVPLGFVRLHDAAAQGVPAIPDPAGRPDAAAAGVGLDTVAGTVVDNYQTCNEVRGQLSALQGWVTAQAALD